MALFSPWHQMKYVNTTDRGEAEIEAMIASGELSDDEPCHLGEGGGRCQNCINAKSGKGHSGP
jgi:hypothetical protein